ncbi:MAG: hypothetical protein ACLQJR_20565 [Stellaceae bacterium]
MDAASLLRQAEKYRSLAKGINDQRTLAMLEQMACELEDRAMMAEGKAVRQRAAPTHLRRKRG